MDMSTIGILGSGTWGTALARMLHNSSHDVTVWSISPEEVNALSTSRRHKNLPNCEILEGIVLRLISDPLVRSKTFCYAQFPRFMFGLR